MNSTNLSNQIIIENTVELEKNLSSIGVSSDVKLVSNVYVPNDVASPDESSKATAITVKNVENIPVSSDTGASASYVAKYQGNPASTGTIANIKSNRYPNIYFNFKRNILSSNGMTFWFKTNDISLPEGVTSTTWDSDSSLINGLSLTGAANSLKIVSAYNTKFYELQSGKTISVNFDLNPVSDPSYTILVFALAHPDPVPVQTLVTDCNKIHKFCASSDTNTFYNLSYSSPSESLNSDNTDKVFRSVFFGSTLNNKNYINPSYIGNYDAINVKNSSFLTDFNNFNASSQALKYYSAHRCFNLAGLPTVLSTPSTAVDFVINDGSSVSFKTFSLFFVQMHGFLSNNSNSNFRELSVQNMINYIQTFYGSLYINPIAQFNSSVQFNIALSNPNSSISTRLFLFDYIHGTATSTELMTRKSKQIVEALAYQYRNILLKSTSDLQIANSSSSLLFPPSLAHPFLNIFAKAG